jgi:hypothetical protein
VTTSRFGSGAISRDSKGSTTTTQRFGDGTIKLHQFGGFSDHLAPWERFHNLAERRARRGRRAGGAGIGEVLVAISAA